MVVTYLLTLQTLDGKITFEVNINQCCDILCCFFGNYSLLLSQYNMFSAVLIFLLQNF